MLAENIINQGGVVFGAKFNDKWEVVHDYTETIDGLAEFRGSKYVQSRIENCYIKTKEFLDTGRDVLFSGTPCQIAGLKRFLRKDYSNLIAVDIICHGVPSPMVWDKYKKSINPNNLLLDKVSFRDKSKGWKTFSFLANGKQTESVITLAEGRLFEDTYLKIFLKNLCLRPSCYHCPARSGKGNSDITIADFWGINTIDSNYDDDKGVSLILPYTTKGLDIINSLTLDKREKSIIVDSKYNPNLHLDCVIPKYRKYFFKKLDQNKLQLNEILISVQKKEVPSKLRVFAYKLKELIKRILKCK